MKKSKKKRKKKVHKKPISKEKSHILTPIERAEIMWSHGALYNVRRDSRFD